MTKPEKFLTIKEVAQILKVDYDTVRKFLELGVIPRNKWFRIGKGIRIRESVLKDL